MTAAIVVAIVFGLANFALAAWAWSRAGRAAELAERADRRAIAADDRAEEAHTILKARFSTDEQRAKAELEAPSIAEGWEGQIRNKRNGLRGPYSSNVFAIHVDITSLAHRLALELLRKRKDELFLWTISSGADHSKATITAYTNGAIITLRLGKKS